MVPEGQPQVGLPYLDMRSIVFDLQIVVMVGSIRLYWWTCSHGGVSRAVTCMQPAQTVDDPATPLQCSVPEASLKVITMKL